VAELSILVPVLRRPGNVHRLVDDIAAATTDVDFEIVFISTVGDTGEHDAIEAERTRRDVTIRHLTMPPVRAGDYARKINHAIASLEATWYFLGADDLHFHPGWFSSAMFAHTQTECLVVGTNDLGNSRVQVGDHSTHTLVHRDYVARGTIDDPTRLLHEGYVHCYVDDEFIQTAIHRGEFVSVTSSVVEHLHPDWGKSDRRNDVAYGISRMSMVGGRRLFLKRREKWQSTSR
jgi:hypothetical protein